MTLFALLGGSKEAISTTQTILNALAKIRSVSGTSLISLTSFDRQLPNLCLSPIYQWAISSQSFPGAVRAWNTVAARDRFQWKNANLKSVIRTIRRNNNNNSTKYNNNNNNLFKKICPQNLVHNEQMQVMLKHKKHSEHWFTKKEPAMWPRQTSNICAIKNKNTQRDCTKSTDEMKYIFKNQIGR